MKTTEFVVEQVLTGLLVLAVLVLALPSDALPSLGPEDDPNALVAGAAVLTVAYLLGVVFDRLADTLLARAEQAHRIKHARRIEERRGVPASRPDPFPEDRIRALVLEKGGGLQDWMDYLRTRIRIVRSVTVFLPAITVVGASRLVTDAQCLPWLKNGRIVDDAEHLPAITAAGCGLVYALVLIANLGLQANESTRLPRTDSGSLDSLESKFQAGREPIVVGAAVFAYAAAMLVLGAAVERKIDLLVPLATVTVLGAAVTALAAWSWWRITKTLFDFFTICWEILSEDPET